MISNKPFNFFLQNPVQPNKLTSSKSFLVPAKNHSVILTALIDNMRELSHGQKCGVLSSAHLGFTVIWSLQREQATHFSSLNLANAGNYILLADIYAKAGSWDEVKRVKQQGLD